MQDRDRYIERANPLYAAVEFLNRTMGDHYTLYALEFGNLAYYADGRFMGDWFGPARYSLITNTSFRPPHLYQQLRKLGANYFLVAENHWIGTKSPKASSLPTFSTAAFGWSMPVCLRFFLN